LSGYAFKAGVQSVIGTLWQVEQQVSRNFLSYFYKHLKAQKQSKTKILQKIIQSEFIEGERNHPYYWSPFLLIGNWL
jgi:CHAT domain-containing protein